MMLYDTQDGGWILRTVYIFQWYNTIRLHIAGDQGLACFLILALQVFTGFTGSL